MKQHDRINRIVRALSVAGGSVSMKAMPNTTDIAVAILHASFALNQLCELDESGEALDLVIKYCEKRMEKDVAL